MSTQAFFVTDDNNYYGIKPLPDICDNVLETQHVLIFHSKSTKHHIEIWESKHTSLGPNEDKQIWTNSAQIVYQNFKFKELENLSMKRPFTHDGHTLIMFQPVKRIAMPSKDGGNITAAEVEFFNSGKIGLTLVDGKVAGDPDGILDIDNDYLKAALHVHFKKMDTPAIDGILKKYQDNNSHVEECLNDLEETCGKIVYREQQESMLDLLGQFSTCHRPAIMKAISKRQSGYGGPLYVYGEMFKQALSDFDKKDADKIWRILAKGLCPTRWSLVNDIWEKASGNKEVAKCYIGGIDTGFPVINDHCKGLQRGEVHAFVSPQKLEIKEVSTKNFLPLDQKEVVTVKLLPPQKGTSFYGVSRVHKIDPKCPICKWQEKKEMELRSTESNEPMRNPAKFIVSDGNYWACEYSDSMLDQTVTINHLLFVHNFGRQQNAVKPLSIEIWDGKEEKEVMVWKHRVTYRYHNLQVLYEEGDNTTREGSMLKGPNRYRYERLEEIIPEKPRELVTPGALSSEMLTNASAFQKAGKAFGGGEYLAAIRKLGEAN